ncbi:MAG: Ig-like domain-containing protein, partial [Armatimonadia bacterium]
TWVTLSNTIIAFNGATGLQIEATPPPLTPSSVTLRYCDVYGHTTDFVNFTSDPTGTDGNISVDPLFANAASGDYRLKSQHGRWDGMAWVLDGETSPCLDAGDPASDYASEPQPNGGRVNVGYDGNTAYASKSADRPPSRPVWVTISPSVPGQEDLTGNCDDSIDPDGQDLTYEYQWAKVNPAGGYLTKWADNPGQVLSAAKVEFGETWQVRARAFDGTSYSTWKAHKKVTITRMVAVIAPASGATNVPVASAIEIAFKWPVVQLSVNRRLRVYNGTALVAGTARWVKQSQRVRFTPKMPLLPGTTYTVRLAEGVETTSGRVLGWSEEYSFTTEGGTGLAAVTVAAARTAAGAQVTVSLSSAATVRAVITNIAGRIVAELPEQDLPAGVSSLLWNGQSRSGTRVPAGTYLVKVQARGADGTQTSALGPLQLR